MPRLNSSNARAKKKLRDSMASLGATAVAFGGVLRFYFLIFIILTLQFFIDCQNSNSFNPSSRHRYSCK
jgi:hypothetical protein